MLAVRTVRVERGAPKVGAKAPHRCRGRHAQAPELESNIDTLASRSTRSCAGSERCRVCKKPARRRRGFARTSQIYRPRGLCSRPALSASTALRTATALESEAAPEQLHAVLKKTARRALTGAVWPPGMYTKRGSTCRPAQRGSTALPFFGCLISRPGRPGIRPDRRLSRL